MIVYLDENFPPHLAKGFQILQQPEGLRTGTPMEVRYIPSTFSHGIEDLDWIPKLGEEKACVITKDLNIGRRKQELEMYQACGLGVFFLKGHSRKQPLNTWETVQALAKHWTEIAKIVHEESRPFGYEFSLSGKIRKVQ
ncbi:MAG: hypothetical protein ABIY71_13070 [Flavobacteriales bacterium]